MDPDPIKAWLGSYPQDIQDAVKYLRLFFNNTALIILKQLADPGNFYNTKLPHLQIHVEKSPGNPFQASYSGPAAVRPSRVAWYDRTLPVNAGPDAPTLETADELFAAAKRNGWVDWDRFGNASGWGGEGAPPCEGYDVVQT